MSESILEEAKRLIHGERNVAYGHPRDNFAAIAAQWDAYLDHTGDRPLNSLDVANLMILMKVARVVNGKYHRDSYTDMAGYAGTGERLQEPIEGPPEEAVTPYRDENEFRKAVGEPRVWDSPADAPSDVKKLVDRGGFTWERRGRRWGWLSMSHGEWIHAYSSELRDRDDGPFTEVVDW